MNSKTKGIIALVIYTILGSCIGIFARVLHDDLALFQQIFLRLITACLVGSIVFFRKIQFSKLKDVPLKDWGLIVVRAIFMYLLGITLATKSFIIGKYSSVSFIMAFPVMAVLGVVLLKEKVSVKKIALILLAFAGTVLITVQDFTHIFNWGLGEFLALLAIIFVSCSNVFRRWHSDVLNNQEITLYILFIASIFTFGASLFNQDSYSGITWDASLIGTIIGAGVISNLLLLTMNYGFQKINDAMLSNTILAFQAVFSVIVSILVYSEIPTAKEIIGGLFIIVSGLIFVKTEMKKEVAKELVKKR